MADVWLRAQQFFGVPQRYGGKEQKAETQTQIENLHHVAIDKADAAQFAAPFKQPPEQQVKDQPADIGAAADSDQQHSSFMIHNRGTEFGSADSGVISLAPVTSALINGR